MAEKQQMEDLLFQKQKEYFQKGKTRELDFRKKQLQRLYSLLDKWETPLLEALSKDLGKSAFEGYVTEIGLLRGEIQEALRHFRRWSAPKHVPGPMLQFPSKGVRYSEPKGCVLIVSPWNYPVQLTLAPLISAIAAGNCAILSLPPDAPCTSAVLEKLLEEGYPKEYITAVLGTIEQNTKLFSLPFDHIFFTGSPRVGKIVMAAAAANLTPVTLELGGKSPCIIMPDAKLSLAARRIVWGKCLNAGQTCVAPDYLLVHESVKDTLIKEIQNAYQQMFPGSLAKNEDFPRIVNQKHFTRLCGLLEGEKVLFGGTMDERTRKIGLTLLDSPSPTSQVMQEEIFGPILPLLTFSETAEVLEWIDSRPKPLACYLFTQNLKQGRNLLQQLSFGGGCLNDTVIHLTSSRLPFGGIGNSGMGSCHGQAGFDTFTHWKSILEHSTWLDIPTRYAPYRHPVSFIKKLMH